jgi:hypothetical protein
MRLKACDDRKITVLASANSEYKGDCTNLLRKVQYLPKMREVKGCQISSYLGVIYLNFSTLTKVEG